MEEAFGHDALEAQEDGSLHVRVSYPDSQWMYGMILSYGPDVQVLEPTSVADSIQSQIEQMYKNVTKS